MTMRRITLPLADCEPAVLTVPEPCTTEALARIEQAAVAALRALRAGAAAAQDDPGSIEFDSWLLAGR
jgi:hypothetical protein